MSDILERLQNYSTPDRTIDEQRQIAQDIYDAAEEITRLAAENAELVRMVEEAAKECGKQKTDNEELRERHSPTSRLPDNEGDNKRKKGVIK